MDHLEEVTRMFPVLYLVVSSGLVVGLVLLVLAVARGRAAPPRRTPWILALAVLGLDTLLHIVATVGMLVAGGSGQFVWSEAVWFVLGTLGFVAIVAVAVLRPRWAGWALLASAAAVPLMFALGGLVGSGVSGPDDASGAPPWPVAIVAYSVPAALSGGLLVLSATARRTADDRADLVAAAPRGS